MDNKVKQDMEKQYQQSPVKGPVDEDMVEAQRQAISLVD